MARALPVSRGKRRAGFTLIELLLATAVGAIVLLVINATFFSALRLHDATHAAIDHDLVVQRALGIVRRDLEGLVLPAATQTANTLAGPLQTEAFSETSLDGVGERVTPDFYTNSGRIDGWTQYADIQTVAYYLTSSNAIGNANKNLVRLVTRNLLVPQQGVSTAEEQVILHDVISAGVSYYDGNSWVDTWDSTTTSTLPYALRFSVVVAPRNGEAVRVDPAPIELIVPVLVKTTTTAQEEAAAGT